MSNDTKTSSGDTSTTLRIGDPVQEPQIPTWKPDFYYFPTQVDAELRDIQRNVLGKVLTLVDALSLEAAQKKAIKDLIRTIVKEQMIKSRHMLDQRMETVLKLGMLPLDDESTDGSSFRFVTSYVVTPVYSEEDILEDNRPY